MSSSRGKESGMPEREELTSLRDSVSRYEEYTDALRRANTALATENVLVRRYMELSRDNAGLQVASVMSSILTWFDKSPNSILNTPEELRENVAHTLLEHQEQAAKSVTGSPITSTTDSKPIYTASSAPKQDKTTLTRSPAQAPRPYPILIPATGTPLLTVSRLEKETPHRGNYPTPYTGPLLAKNTPYKQSNPAPDTLHASDLLSNSTADQEVPRGLQTPPTQGPLVVEQHTSPESLLTGFDVTQHPLLGSTYNPSSQSAEPSDTVTSSRPPQIPHNRPKSSLLQDLTTSTKIVQNESSLHPHQLEIRRQSHTKESHETFHSLSSESESDNEVTEQVPIPAIPQSQTDPLYPPAGYVWNKLPRQLEQPPAYVGQPLASSTPDKKAKHLQYLDVPNNMPHCSTILSSGSAESMEESQVSRNHPGNTSIPSPSPSPCASDSEMRPKAVSFATPTEDTKIMSKQESSEEIRVPTYSKVNGKNYVTVKETWAKDYIKEQRQNKQGYSPNTTPQDSQVPDATVTNDYSKIADVPGYLLQWLGFPTPSRRLIGEIAYQLDKRILTYVFKDTEIQRKRRRFYGFTVQNIPLMIQKECRDRSTGKLDKRRQYSLEFRYRYLVNSLRPLGYCFEFHPDMCAELVNSFGLLPLPPRELKDEYLSPHNKQLFKYLLRQVAPAKQLEDITLLLECLARLAKDDGKPMFLW